VATREVSEDETLFGLLLLIPAGLAVDPASR